MRAFDVLLNGKRLCVAGVGDNGVLSTIVNHVAGFGRDEVSLRVGGLASATEEHVTWRALTLRVGDEVTVRIIEADSVDKPRSRYRPNSKQDERNSKAYIQALAKKFGWKLIASPKKKKSK